MEDIEVCYKNTSTGENVNLFWDEVPSSSLDEEDDLPRYVYICGGDPLVVRKTVNDSMSAIQWSLKVKERLIKVVYTNLFALFCHQETRWLSLLCSWYIVLEYTCFFKNIYGTYNGLILLISAIGKINVYRSRVLQILCFVQNLRLADFLSCSVSLLFLEGVYLL